MRTQHPNGGYDSSGVIVVTLFRCESISNILRIWIRHKLLMPKISENVPGFLGVHMYPRWSSRELRSVSLWRCRADILGMGEVPEHVALSRFPARIGIETVCGIFEFSGDWKTLLFGVEMEQVSPIDLLALP